MSHGLTAGFDGTVMSSINSMTQWQKYFGLVGAASKTGIVFVSERICPELTVQGMYTVGQVCAFFPASYLPDRVGRRKTMFIGNIFLW